MMIRIMHGGIGNEWSAANNDYIMELYTLYPRLHSDFAHNTTNTAFQCELFSADSLSLSPTA